MAQNIHRHPICPFHDRRIISAVAWSATGSAICQLTICALRIPSTTVNWLMDTKRPRKWAGAISAINMGLRPNLSLSLPALNAPMRQPINALLMAHP